MQKKSPPVGRLLIAFPPIALSLAINRFDKKEEQPSSLYPFYTPFRRFTFSYANAFFFNSNLLFLSTTAFIIASYMFSFTVLFLRNGPVCGNSLVDGHFPVADGIDGGSELSHRRIQKTGFLVAEAPISGDIRKCRIHLVG